MSQSDYSFGSRILHHLALGSAAVVQTSFDMESLLKNVETQYGGPHVFVSGLARAGTTVLMRALYDTDIFRSLTYRDMPFLLMPNLWAQVSSRFRKYRDLSGRVHGDRIQVNFDSPEAFEEVFWRAYCGRDYIASDRLKPHDVDDHTIELFRRYIDHILASDDQGRDRYLSKNNNNVLRLPVIKKCFPNAVIVIPFRNPIQQAISLFRQHRKFSARHKIDRFSRVYMNWLGHHEFGETHRPFDFGDGSQVPGAWRDPKDINYWLRVWYRTYHYVQSTAPEDSIFLSYESLCKDSTTQCHRILEAAELETLAESVCYPFEISEERSIDGLDDALVEESLALYKHC